MRNAHAQDFEKKKKPELGVEPAKDDDSDDDDDNEDEQARSASLSGDVTPRGGEAETEDEREIAAVRDEVEIGMAGGSGSAGRAV